MALTEKQLAVKKAWREKNKDYNQKYYLDNKDKVKEQLRQKYQYLKNDEPWRLAVRRARTRAKNKGLEFNIDDDYIKSIWQTTCPILGIPLFSADFGSGMSRAESKAKPQDNSPTLDRIDSSKGYIKGNIVVMSYRANMIKNCGTLEEHRKIVSFLESEHSEQGYDNQQDLHQQS